jgi:hypothetical protein
VEGKVAARRCQRALLAVSVGAWIGLFLVPMLAVSTARANGVDCSATLGTSFESQSKSGTTGASGAADCFTLSGVSSGDKVLVKFSVPTYENANPAWKLTNSNGSTRCEGGASPYGASCEIRGIGPWTVSVLDLREEESFSYSLNIRRLTDPEGCSGLGEPAAWSFGAARREDSISEGLEARCYTFSRSPGEEDGMYWFRTVRTSGTLSPRWTVYGPSGSEECSGGNAELAQGCRLVASGGFAIVVANEYGPATGSFYLTSKKLTTPADCGELASTGFAAAPSEGSISGSGDADCLKIPGVSAGERVLVGYEASGVSGDPYWTIVNGGGTSICSGSYNSGYQSPCALNGPGPWYVVTYDQSGVGSFGYSLAVRRLTNPEGCSSLGDPAVWSFAAPRKNGTLGNKLATNCYTFSRAEAEEDGTYWLRAFRTSGTLQPAWSVYGPSGSAECSSSWYTEPDQSCRLLGAGQYTIVLSDASGEGTGSYFLDAKKLNEAQGCGSLPSSSFEAAPQSGSAANAGEIDCYSIPEGLGGKAVSVGLLSSGLNGASPAWALVNPNGSIVCMSRNYGPTDSCPVASPGVLSLLVYDAGGTGTFNYDLALRRLTDPQGCTSLGDPAVWSFTAPRTVGSISTGLGAHCYTFTRSEGEADDHYWLRIFHTSGTLDPRWTVYGPSGARECSGSSSGPDSSCELRASGQFEIVVSDSSGTGTGGYALTAKSLTKAQGCGTLPSLVLGIPGTNGNLSVGGEADCYALPATEGDELSFNLSGAADSYAVVAPSGKIVCTVYDHPCRIDEDESPFSLLVYSSSGQAGSYRVGAECLNIPCGQVSTAVTDASPRHLGQSRSATILLRGHDLDLLDRVTLTHGGTEVEGHVEETPSGARSAEVRFDLAGAAAGSWTVEAHFLDGTAKFLPGAVTVEAALEGGVSVETVGRETFRPGTPTHVTVVVSNSGNVDAIGVPVVLRGLPTGSTIEPSFEQYRPVGSPQSVSLAKAPYNQASESIIEDGEVIAPFLAARVPAGRSVTMEFAITVPSLVTYKLRVFGGECLAKSASAGSLAGTSARSLSAASGGGGNADCAGVIASKVAGALLGSCGSVVSDPMIQAAVSANGGEKFWSWGHAIGWLANTAVCAGEIVVPESKLVTASLHLLDDATKLSGDIDVVSNCLLFPSESGLQQRGVVSVDPNELEGPAGVGAERYLQASSPLSYQVLFENIASATAAAQKVTITDQLDSTMFEPSSVLFTAIEFGSTHYEVPVPTNEVDTTIDLRPQENAEVHVTGSVTAGTLKVELEAIDPDTLQPPEDPDVGVLSPNVDPPGGEGRLLFTVAPRALFSGATISNKATIRFDQNAPIETNTGTNVVDREAPQPTIGASSVPGGAAADVSWGGTDDAAGIDQWRLEVSRDGGAFEPWRVASEAGSTEFKPQDSGSYSFRAVAYDGAGNSGQSSIAGVTLTGGQLPQREEEGATSTPPASSSGGMAPLAPPGSASPTPAPIHKLRCRKGFRKAKVHGKAKCLKVEKKRGHAKAR